MGKNQLAAPTPVPAPVGEKSGVLAAEEGASLSSGSLRLYYLLPSLEKKAGQGGKPVGAIDLYNYDPLNRRCAVGIMVASEHRRQGHALDMLHALDSLYAPAPNPQPPTSAPLHTLYADIAASNTASINLFRKAGYYECGHFRDWLLVGNRYIDSIRMQKTLS